MSAIRRDVRLGRLDLLTLEGELLETLGESLEAVGGGVVPGERRARPFNLIIPIHGDPLDTNPGPYERAERLRRQVRSLIDNSRARLEGIYFRFFVDPDMNGWLVAGGGDLAYTEGGPSVSEYVLTLTDTYQAGNRRTHRAARRLEVYDRRLSSTARDYLGTFYGTPFSEHPYLPKHFLPPNARDILLSHREGYTATLRPTMGGLITCLHDRPHGEVVSYDQPEESIVSGSDCVVYDRRGLLSPTAPALTTNLVTNPSFETNTTGWSAANATVARDGTRSKAGSFCLRSTRTAGGGDTSMASYAITLPGAGAYTVSLDVLVPDGWDGTGLSLAAENFAGASGTLSVSPSVTTRGRWQRASFTFTAAGGDLAGNIVLRATGSSAGSLLYIDALLVEAGSVVNDYYDGDGGWCDWSGTPHASTSRNYGDMEDVGWEEVYGPNWPLAFGDIPVIQNGLTRVRAHASTPGVLVVDSFVTGTGWQEQGMIYVRREISSSYTRYDELRSANVVQWSPDRAVIRATFGIAAEPGEAANVYISVQRGWTGPRIEAYTVADVMVGLRNVELLWEPFDSGHVLLGWGQDVPLVTGIGSQEPGVTWSSGSVLYSFTGDSYPFVFLRPSARKTMVAGILRAGLHVHTRDSTVGYGSTRHGFSVRAASAFAGYISFQLGFMETQPALLEAETYINSGGTRTLVADANAVPGSGNSAVQDTAASEGTAAVIVNDATLDSLGIEEEHTHGLWVRIRRSSGSGTMAVRGRFGTINYFGTAFLWAVDTYTWVYLGEASRLTGEDLSIFLWGDTGTPDARIDRFAVVPHHLSSFIGLADLWQANLADSRQVPSLVSR